MSSYAGVIIAESLDAGLPQDHLIVQKTDIEPVTADHRTPWLRQWTLHTVEVPDDKIDYVVHYIADHLDQDHPWYADFKNDQFHYIVFRAKIFRVDRSQPEEYDQVVQFGTSSGIPPYQLDFTPDIADWQR